MVFHHLPHLARQEAAFKLGFPEDDLTCDRNQEYDQFADDGRVPPRRMLADGYWFDCPHCGVRIQADNPGITPLRNILVKTGDEVFCQAKCAVSHEPIRRELNQRFEIFKKRIQRRYPNLRFTVFHGGYPHRFNSAQFEFPGGMFPGTVQQVEEGLRWCISEGDLEAWHKLDHRE